MREEAAAYLTRLTAEKTSEGGATTAAGESPQVAVREEEVKDAQDTVKDLAGLFWEKEMEAAEKTAVAVEEAPARLAAAAVPSGAAGAVSSWTYL